MDDALKLFDEWREAKCGFKLYLSPDELQCCLTMLPESPLSFSAEWLSGMLQQHGIIIGLDPDAILKGCALVNQGRRVSDLLVAEGRPPVLPVPAGMEFKVQVSTTIPQYDTSEKGKIDYHQTHLFENVTAGQLIGVRTPEQAGVPGCSVRGNPIPFPATAAPALRTGAGVELSDDDSCFAMIDGRVVFEENTVSVSNELIIEGDVDYEVGDIDFIGFVHIRRSIREGYVVRARQGLVVDHIVENTHIESAGDIQIGGMAGDGEHGTIRCGGNLSSRYLHEVHVECAGNIDIGGEAMNCQLRAGGTLTAALIAGGTALVLGGIEANRFGSDSGGRTFLRAGVDFHHIDDLEHIEKRLVPLLQQRYTMSGPEAGPDPSGELALKLAGLNEQIQKLEEERLKVLRPGGRMQNAKVNVRKALFDGVVIHLGITQEVIRDYRSGAYSIIEHARQGLVFLPLTPLEKNAAELERELLLKEQQSGEA